MKDKCLKCGICCKLFMINLTEEEYKSGKYTTQFEEFGIVKDFIEAEMCGANIIMQKKDGSCFYLKKGRCSIHKMRPKSCRKFFCTTKDPRLKCMVDKITEYKKSF